MRQKFSLSYIIITVFKSNWKSLKSNIFITETFINNLLKGGLK